MSNGESCGMPPYKKEEKPRRKNRWAYVPAAAMLLASAVPALGSVGDVSASSDSLFLGTPGEPNCHGESISNLARSDTRGLTRGLKSAAEIRGLSVRQLQVDVSLWCMFGGMM